MDVCVCPEKQRSKSETDDGESGTRDGLATLFLVGEVIQRIGATSSHTDKNIQRCHETPPKLPKVSDECAAMIKQDQCLFQDHVPNTRCQDWETERTVVGMTFDDLQGGNDVDG